MTRLWRIALVLVIALVTACGPATPAPTPVRPAPPTPVPANPTTTPPSPFTPPPSTPPVSPSVATTVAPFAPTQRTEGASVTTAPGMIVVHLPASECTQVTATPLVVGDFIVFATHKLTPKPDQRDAPESQCLSDPTPPGLYAVSSVTGEAFTLIEGVSVEATAAYADGAILLPTLFGGKPLAMWQNGQTSYSKPLGAALDSAGLWDAAASRFIVGSVNSPFAQCQDGPNPDCGALVAVDLAGNTLARLDRASGLRGWLTGGPTTDGAAYFFGTGSGMDGTASPNPNSLHECSVVKVDKDFRILAAFDDGTEGCAEIGNLESAVVGEAPVAGGVLWAQHLGGTDGQATAPVSQLRAADLSVICRAEIPVLAGRSAAGYYQGPVVDAAGNAYVTTRTMQNGMKASLVRIAPDCSTATLLNTAADLASSPTLADDRSVLVAAAGVLHVVDRTTGQSTEYPLGSSASVVGGAVITPNGVAVASMDGTVTILTGTGIRGYGSDPWPRFRKDNSGSAGGQ